MYHILHDHCYTDLVVGESLPYGQADPKQRKRSPKDTNQCPNTNNDLVEGLPEGYAASATPSNSAADSNHPNTSARRKISLLDGQSNGTSPKSKKSTKIHELLFGEYEDSQYVDGVPIPDTQTVSSEEGKSITTSDFGLYINNPSTYSSISSDDTRAILNRSERLAIFGSSMSVDSETEILEAASTLMDLARNSLNPAIERIKPHRKTKLKTEKIKQSNSNLLKLRNTTEMKSQKRKYTKRKGTKKYSVKEKYSMWTNGNKYDEFEYYATKPLNRNQGNVSKRKNSRRSQESELLDSELKMMEYDVNGEMKQEEEQDNEEFKEELEQEMLLQMEGAGVGDRAMRTNELKPKGKRKRKLNQAKHVLAKSGKDQISASKQRTIKELQSDFGFTLKQTSSRTSVKDWESPNGSPIPSSSKLHEQAGNEMVESGDEEMDENGFNSDEEAVKLAQLQTLTRPIQRRGKRKSFCSDEDDNTDTELTYHPIKFEPGNKEEGELNPWGQALPPNVLLTIFKMVVNQNGVAPFLARASSVCKLWNSVAAEPSLWRICNLSIGCVRKLKRCFRWLCKYRFSQTTVLNLANWEVLTYKEMDMLGSKALLIQSLNLSRCSRITPASLRTLIESLEHIKHLDLSFATTFIASKFVLEQLILLRGGQLESLNCSYNILVKFDAILFSIIRTCKNLRVLDLSNAIFSSCLLPIHIEHLQMGCPHLKRLLLANSLFKAKHAWGTSPGFSELEELNVARSAVSHLSKFRYVDDVVLFRFLRTSQKLKVLDVSGCRYISNQGLQQLDVPNLESLSLSYCRASLQPEIEVTISRWSHSLTELDLSGNSMNKTLMRSVLKKCRNLESLNLSGCKGLPWDKRREFNRQEIIQMRQTMSDWLDCM